MDNKEKWNSRKESAQETEAVNSSSERFYLGYTATAREDWKKKHKKTKPITLTDSARVEN